MKQTLSIDIETYSSNDLTKCGVYKYVEAEDFEVLLISYSQDGGKIITIDTVLESPAHHDAGEDYRPYDLEIAAFKALLFHPEILKTAHNAQFERVCLSKFFGVDLPADQWDCTMVKAATVGFPFSLDAVAKAMKLPVEKDAAGKALIRFFCVPCKPTKTNGGRTRNMPEHAPEKWEAFKSYCANDVRVEMQIREQLNWVQWGPNEKELWLLDQAMNDTGILIDAQLVDAAISVSAEQTAQLLQEAVQLTGLDNPNSANQLKAWLSEAMDRDVDSLRKDDVPVLLKETNCETVTRVLEIRQQLSKSSVKKYEAMRISVCQDGRIRGLLQFYGASRTGRWAGRLVQVQNLPKNHLPDLSLARETVIGNDTAWVEILFGNIQDTLSQLIRTSFIAKPGHRLLVADFSAIEARVIAWLAGERWRMDVFNSHGKIYEASAAQMFRVPIEQVTKGSPLRQKGKVSELALGYQGGPNALLKMGALEMGIPEEELPKLVKMWRNANTKIVQLWYDVEAAAREAINGHPSAIQHGVKFYMERSSLVIQLPSGRKLFYVDPQNAGQILYEGMNQTTKKWEVVETYGGKLVENIVQAIARDCLATAMLRLSKNSYRLLTTIHDEVMCEMPDGMGSAADMCWIMGQPISWAPGLPLKADGYETQYYYKKD